MNLTRVAGPALAGFLILLVDTAGVFFIVAGVYVFSALSIIMVNYDQRTELLEKKSVIADIKEGLSYSFSVPDLRGLFIMTFIPVLFLSLIHI